MTEEYITKKLMGWLKLQGWVIVCFDFPQSGTGVFLHPNGTTEKNKNTINPDVVAVKGHKCLYFENKSYFYFKDFEKINFLRNTKNYSIAFDALLKGYSVDAIYYGIGYPSSAHKRKAQASQHMVDFIIGINDDLCVEVLYSIADNLFA